jgi:preprotein translocase subunit SecB
MSEDTNTNEVNALPPFSMDAQYVKDLSFENPDPLNTYSALENERPHVNVEIQVQGTPLANTSFEVALQLRIEAKVNDKVAYICELTYAGILTVAEGIPEDILGQLIMVYAPTALFPFARSVIANTVREGGFPQIMLAPVDFLSLYQRQFDAGEGTDTKQ